MDAASTESRAPARRHSAFLFETACEMSRRVALASRDALAQGSSVLWVATDDHLAGIRQAMIDLGADVDALVNAGRLTMLSAWPVLDQLMIGDELQRDVFLQRGTELIETARGDAPGLFAFGELVNLLWARGNQRAAELLEQWWNELAPRYNLTLMCGYHGNPFDQDAQSLLESLCTTHTHLDPVECSQRFDGAVSAGLQSVFPHAEIDTMRAYLAEQCPHATTHMPAGQAAMLGLRRLLPALADRLRLEAAWHYRQQRG